METYTPNESRKEYKEILITGEGAMQSKMYLENLTDELCKRLLKDSIHCHYTYLGDPHKMDIEQAYEKAKAGQYDAVLRMVPRKEKEIIHVYENRYSYNGNMVGNEHVNEFDLTLKDNTGTLVWKGSLRTDIDPVARNIYKGITIRVIAELAENLIVPAN
jgi:hypothetical protein